VWDERRLSGDDGSPRVPRLLRASLAACLVAVSPGPAAAGLIELLFGGPAQTRVPVQPVPSDALTRTSPFSGPSRSRTGGQAYCVRQCDGFFFPAPGGASVQAGPEAICDAVCPGTVVYRLSGRGPNEGIDEARGPAGARYGDLPTAYSYRRTVTPACGCGAGIRQDWALRALTDVTLRRGDLVVTGEGASVFRGDGKRPPAASDFVDLRFPGATPPALVAQADRVLGFTFRAEMARRAAVERVRTADRTLEITVTAVTRGRPDPREDVRPAGPRIILDAPFAPR
jgi:hypothetical protein